MTKELTENIDFEEIVDTLSSLYEIDNTDIPLFFMLNYSNGVHGITLNQDILLYDTDSDGLSNEDGSDYTTQDIISICITRLTEVGNLFLEDPRKVES